MLFNSVVDKLVMVCSQNGILYSKNNNKKNTTTFNNVIESLKHDIGQSIYCTIPYIKWENRQNECMAMEVKLVAVFGET